MTRDRGLFRRHEHESAIPVIEGRMVHQYRYAAKAYATGTGRRARWDPRPNFDLRIRPQYWLDPADLPATVADRIAFPRVGFCDITGQTNERTVLASMIPRGVVCGNKVPTITFRGALPDLASVWLGLANSFAFDWQVRRSVTTTLNFFILEGSLVPDRLLAQPTRDGIVALVSDLTEALRDDSRQWTVGTIRARIDALVASSYRLSVDDFRTVLADFPLLDRGQPPLPGERQSTVTTDLAMREALRILDDGATRSNPWSSHLDRRIAMARDRGALPYTPAQFATISLPT